MAKKERPRLVMADDVAVTDLQSLKDHFDWEKALQYYKTGELGAWLRRLYFDDEADALEKLDSRSADFPKEFCAIFGVEYTGDKPYIPPSSPRTRANVGPRRKAPTPPPRPVSMPQPTSSVAPVAPMAENIADVGVDLDFGEALADGITEEMNYEEDSTDAATLQTEFIEKNIGVFEAPAPTNQTIDAMIPPELPQEPASPETQESSVASSQIFSILSRLGRFIIFAIALFVACLLLYCVYMFLSNGMVIAAIDFILVWGTTFLLAKTVWYLISGKNWKKALKEFAWGVIITFAFIIAYVILGV